MNQAHWHLAINHLPIIIPIIGFLVLAGGFVLNNATVKRTAFTIFVFGAISTIPAFFTGEGAEDIAKTLAGVTKSIIHEHEEKAELFAILSYLLGGMSLLGLWSSIKEKRFSHMVSIVILLLAAITLFLGKQTGTSGGEIRHTEIRAGFDVNASNPASNPADNTENKDSDD